MSKQLIRIFFLLLLAATTLAETLVAGGKPVSSRIVLLLGFSNADDPAVRDLEAGFRTGCVVAGRSDIQVIRADCAYEAARACDACMRPDSAVMIAFAGDEGSAAAVALQSAKYRFPVIKLTADGRSCTGLSDYLIEFLPSQEMQARVLAEYLAREEQVTSALMLVPGDARGQALAGGFTAGARAAGVRLDGSERYHSGTQNISTELARLFSGASRLAQGGEPLGTALTSDERMELFGTSDGGEVLLASAIDTPVEPRAVEPREVLFLALTPDKIDLFSGQLRIAREQALIAGNSGWMNPGALDRQRTAVDGLYLVVPLLPQFADTGLAAANYREQNGRVLTEWSALGLDAGRFVAERVASATGTDGIVRTAEYAPFTGLTAATDFQGGRENRHARILRYEGGQLRVVQ